MGVTVTAAPARVGRFPQTADINVVPFVDVMLVLLIIFMVAAPIATTALRADLPPAPEAPPPNPGDPVFVSVEPGGIVRVGERVVTVVGLGAALAEASHGDRDTRILVRAAPAVLYGEVMATMNAIDEAAYTKVAIVGEDL